MENNTDNQYRHSEGTFHINEVEEFQNKGPSDQTRFTYESINYIHEVLPRDINDIVQRKLLASPRWTVVTANLPIDVYQKVENASDTGHIICSYRSGSSSVRIESEEISTKTDKIDEIDPCYQELNVYARLIQELCLNACLAKGNHSRIEAFSHVEVLRYFWNYYSSASTGVRHTDIKEKNHWSIIYYLNDCPGTGTRIWQNEYGEGESVLVPHVAGTAVLFPAWWMHTGMGATENRHRCALNILFKARTNGGLAKSHEDMPSEVNTTSFDTVLDNLSSI